MKKINYLLCFFAFCIAIILSVYTYVQAGTVSVFIDTGETQKLSHKIGAVILDYYIICGNSISNSSSGRLFYQIEEYDDYNYDYGNMGYLNGKYVTSGYVNQGSTVASTYYGGVFNSPRLTKNCAAIYLQTDSNFSAGAVLYNNDANVRSMDAQQMVEYINNLVHGE